MAADGSAVELDAAVAALQRALADPAWGAAADAVTLQRLLAAAVVLYGRKVAREGWIPPFDAGAGGDDADRRRCLPRRHPFSMPSRSRSSELALWKS